MSTRIFSPLRESLLIDAPLWETIKEKSVTCYAFIYKHKISRSLIDKLKHDKNVNVSTTEHPCEILGCKVE